MMSSARALRSLICAKASVKPVLTAISSMISGSSARGIRAATSGAQCLQGRRVIDLVEGAEDKLVLAIHPFKSYGRILWKPAATRR